MSESGIWNMSKNVNILSIQTNQKRLTTIVRITMFPNPQRQ